MIVLAGSQGQLGISWTPLNGVPTECKHLTKSELSFLNNSSTLDPLQKKNRRLIQLINHKNLKNSNKFWLTNSCHNTHWINHICGVGQLNTNFRQRRTDRSHRIRNHIHSATWNNNIISKEILQLRKLYNLKFSNNLSCIQENDQKSLGYNQQDWSSFPKKIVPIKFAVQRLVSSRCR